MTTNRPLPLVTNAVPNLPSSAGQDINAPLPSELGLVDMPSTWDWLIRLGIAALLLLLAWWGWRLWQRQAAGGGAVESPASKARRLLREALTLQSQPEVFVQRVSDISRAFLEDQFGLHAPDRTTEEFLSELQKDRRLLPQHQSALAGFLAECDLVKFARHEPEREELEKLHNVALQLVDETTAPQPPRLGSDSSIDGDTATPLPEPQVLEGREQVEEEDPDARYRPSENTRNKANPGGRG